MWKRYLVVTLFLALFSVSQLMSGHNTKLTAIASARTSALQTTCSCGVDCGSNTCTFDCQGTFSGCLSCINSCCRAEFQRECGILP